MTRWRIVQSRNARALVLGMFLLGHLATWSLGHSIALAQVPQLLTYQGRLTERDGASLAGEHTVTFRLYDAETGGSKVWEEEHHITIVPQDNGIFSLVLGSLTPLGKLDFNRPLWLAIAVDKEGEMTPRQRLTAVGYAINADTLDGLDSNQLLRADVDAVAKGQLKLTRSGLGLLIQPSTDPTANTKLFDVQNAASVSKFSVDLEGDVSVTGDLSVTGIISGSTNTTGTTSPSWTIGSNTDATTSTTSLLFGQSTGQKSIRFKGDSTGDFTFSDPIRLSQQATLRLEGATAAGAYVALKAPGSPTTYTLTLPATVGAAGQVLTTDAAGNLSWANDANSGGTITGVTAGNGLTGGGTTGTVTLDVGAGTGLIVAADAVSVDVGTTANKIVQLDATGALPALSGTNLTSLNASNLTSGTVPDARLSANVSLLGTSIESSEITDGTITAADTAASFLVAGSGVSLTKGATSWQLSATGSGGTITGVTAGNGLIGGGTTGTVTLDVGAGTGLIVAADAVSVDVGTTANKIVQLDAAGALPAVSGASLVSLNASTLASGTVPDARLSANVSLLGPSIESSEITDGTITRAKLGTDSVGPAQLASDAIQPGDIEPGDLPSFGRASTASSSSLAIGTTDTTLLSVTVNKTTADSALLIIASVAVSHSSGGSKIVTVKLHRDGTLLDAGYVTTLKSGDQGVVSIHAWDVASAGSHTIELKASVDNAGATATVRRLTAIELL